jgi:hypothetical protein
VRGGKRQQVPPLGRRGDLDRDNKVKGGLTAQLNRLLKSSKKQIPRELNFTPTSAKTALVGDSCSPARDDKNKELSGPPKGVPFQNNAEFFRSLWSRLRRRTCQARVRCSVGVLRLLVRSPQRPNSSPRMTGLPRAGVLCSISAQPVKLCPLRTDRGDRRLVE